MAQLTEVIYPSAGNQTNVGKPDVRLKWAISYFEQLLQSIPHAAQASARIVGWNQLSVDFTRNETKNEVTAKAKSTIEAIPVAANGSITLNAVQRQRLLDFLDSITQSPASTTGGD